jgi:hypothetical protein
MVGGQHDVGRLEIAVHDPVLVRGLEPVGDLPGELSLSGDCCPRFGLWENVP